MAGKAKADTIARRKRRALDTVVPEESAKVLPEADIIGGLDDAELELGQEKEEESDDEDVESDAELDPFPEIDARSSDGEDANERELDSGLTAGNKKNEEESGAEEDEDEQGYDSDDIDNWDEDAEDGEWF